MTSEPTPAELPLRTPLTDHSVMLIGAAEDKCRDLLGWLFGGEPLEVPPHWSRLVACASKGHTEYLHHYLGDDGGPPVPDGVTSWQSLIIPIAELAQRWDGLPAGRIQYAVDNAPTVLTVLLAKLGIHQTPSVLTVLGAPPHESVDS